MLTIYFTDTGQRAFTELTRQIVDRQLALEVDGVVLSAPVIRSVIEGEAELSGFDEQEASDLLERLGVGS